MGCGLEERNIACIYDAARYGWDEAMERICGEVILCAEEIEPPVTDRYLAERHAKLCRAEMIEAAPRLKLDLT